MWVYWIQSVIIGFFSFLKILASAFADRREPQEMIWEALGVKSGAFQILGLFGRLFQAVFFVLHYGGFHFAYFFFLLAFSANGSFGSGSSEVMGIWVFLIVGLVFFINHLISFMTYFNEERLKPMHELMFEPYRRIIPLHLTIIFLGFAFAFFSFAASIAVLVFFIILKTAVDIAMHVNEHSKGRELFKIF